MDYRTGEKPARLFSVLINRFSAKCSRARPPPSSFVLESFPAPKDRAGGRGTRDEDELAWQVHGPETGPVRRV
jgi:hypothetical protein